MIRYLSTLFLATGCSWIGMTSPPVTGGNLECEERAAPPIVDGVMAAALGGVGAAVLVGTTNADYHNAAVVLVSVPAVLIGTVFLASALHGVHLNRACRAAHATRSVCTSDDVACAR